MVMAVLLSALDSCYAGAMLACSPVHRDGVQVLGLRYQSLVSQIPQHQPLGMGSQGHEGDDFFLIQVNRQSTFTWYVQALLLALSVHSLDGLRELSLRLRQMR